MPIYTLPEMKICIPRRSGVPIFALCPNSMCPLSGRRAPHIMTVGLCVHASWLVIAAASLVTVRAQHDCMRYTATVPSSSIQDTTSSAPVMELSAHDASNTSPQRHNIDIYHTVGLMPVVTPTKSGHNARRWCGHTCVVYAINPGIHAPPSIFV